MLLLVTYLNVEVFIADSIFKTFSFSYKHVILGYYIKDRSLKPVVLLYILFYFYVNFTFINARLQKANLFLWCLKKRLKCM